MKEYRHYTDYGYLQTITTVCIGGNTANVVISCVPGLSYWSRPDNKTLRGWVDTELIGTGKRRVGKVYWRNGGGIGKWYAVYELVGIDTLR